MITTALYTSAQGLQTQAKRAGEAADSIVRQGAKAVSAEPVSQPAASEDGGTLAAQLAAQEADGDFTKDIVRLIEADVAYRANAEAIRTEEELARETVDLVS